MEHKLFESEELDAFQRFAATGASANAYTSFDKTCYLFQCGDHFDQSLEILLDFVQSTRTLRLKRWKKSRGLSARRSPCTMMYLAG